MKSEPGWANIDEYMVRAKVFTLRSTITFLELGLASLQTLDQPKALCAWSIRLNTEEYIVEHRLFLNAYYDQK